MEAVASQAIDREWTVVVPPTEATAAVAPTPVALTSVLRWDTVGPAVAPTEDDLTCTLRPLEETPASAATEADRTDSVPPEVTVAVATARVSEAL